MISLIIPTLNERESMERLLPELAQIFSVNNNIELVIIDDGSSDGTVQYVKNQIQFLPFHVTIVERSECGLATAVIRGFKEARGDILCVMDADLSHPPNLLVKLIEEINNGADIAVGSRRVKNGGVEEWPLIRKIYSYVSTWFSRPISRGVKDPLSGFFVLKRSIIDGILLNPIGYKILLEILVKGKFKRAVEVPYIFRNRDVGKSKLSTKIALQYYKHLLRLYFYRLTHLTSNKIIANVILLVITIIICIGIMEITYRIKVEKYYYIFPKGMYTSHATRCFSFTPNFQGEVTAREFTTINKINSKGLRDKEYNYERITGVPRVLAIGDSFVSQYAVPHEQSFLKIMETRSHYERKNIEIIAGGINGYNTIQERIFFEEEGLKYKPDLVFAFFYINDLASNKEYHSLFPSKCVDSKGRLIGKPTKYNDSFLSKFIHSVRSIPFFYYKTKDFITYITNTASINIQSLKESLDYYNTDGISDATREMFEITSSEFVSMRDSAKKIGARFAVVIVPEKAVIDDRQKFIKEFSSIIPTVVPEEPNRILTTYLFKEKIEVFDLTNALQTYKKNNKDELLYNELDNHWTSRANEIVAQTLYPYIITLLNKPTNK